MTPLEIHRENQRREREALRKARGTLPKRGQGPLPAEAKAEIERIKAEFEARKSKP